MRAKRNTENGKYYAISNPTVINEKTGMFCISPKYYQNYDKDYIFEWFDPHTKTYMKKILDKEYVKDHATFIRLSKWDAEHINKEYKGYCYIISLKDILAYG